MCMTEQSELSYQAMDETAEKAQARLLELLAHAVKEADGWHDDAHGGPLTGDPLIEEARAIIKAEGA